VKQLAFLVIVLIGGALGAIVHPFYGILPYYMLSIVRPQSLWDYALPETTRWSLIAAVIAITGAIIHTHKIIGGLRWNPVASLLALFSALVVLGAITAHDTAVSGPLGQDYIKLIVMALLATVVIQRLAHVRILMLVIIASSAYVAWEYNARYLLDNRLDIFFRGHGGLDNNDTGVALAIGFVLSYWLWQARRSWPARAAVALGAGVMVHALMLSYSRSGMVAALAGVGWIALWHRPRRQLLLLLPLLLGGVVYLAGPEVRSEFLSIKEYEQDATAQKRIDSWQRGWETAWDHPLTGAGLRNSNLMSEAYGAELNGRSIHNVYLQIAADSGIPALMVYLALIVVAVFGLWSFRLRLSRGERPVTRGDRGEPDPAARDQPDRQELAGLCLALEAGLITFAAGGVFLSLEFFELPYLLMVMAGVLPVVGRARVEADAKAALANAIDLERLNLETPRGDAALPGAS